LWVEVYSVLKASEKPSRLLAPMEPITRPRILVVEDDPKLGKQVADRLDAAGFACTWVNDGEKALAEWSAHSSAFALIVLDLMLPGVYGMDVLKHVRKDSDVPVLVLSARQDAADRVRALELGADDYVTKPFWPDELVARVHARLRRPVLRRAGLVRLGGLAVDLEARSVDVAGASVVLTKVEFDLLAALARRPGSAVARAWLVEHVLDPDRDGTERTLDVHVSRLRKKLGDEARRVVTVWGVGYRLDVGGSATADSAGASTGESSGDADDATDRDA
jgi:DNA-binding response OmpR family regulator